MRSFFQFNLRRPALLHSTLLITFACLFPELGADAVQKIITNNVLRRNLKPVPGEGLKSIMLVIRFDIRQSVEQGHQVTR